MGPLQAFQPDYQSDACGFYDFDRLPSLADAIERSRSETCAASVCRELKMLTLEVGLFSRLERYHSVGRENSPPTRSPTPTGFPEIISDVSK